MTPSAYLIPLTFTSRTAMSSAKYQALPSDDDHDEELAPAHRRFTSEHRRLAQDPRFNPPTPSWWKRALLILFIIVMFWLSLSLRASMQKGAQSPIIHAHRCAQRSSVPCSFLPRHRGVLTALFLRYSKEYKHRPAASPIIYEKLKDGRTRVRGAAPHARSL